MGELVGVEVRVADEALPDEGGEEQEPEADAEPVGVPHPPHRAETPMR